MLDFLTNLFTREFMPHGHCYQWLPSVLWTNVISDVVICIAYFSIPPGLIYLVHKRNDIKVDWLFLMFASFIFFCGATHIIDAINVWHGFYRFAGLVKLITATVSIATAIMLWVIMPSLLSFPSREQLELEVAERSRVEQELLAIKSSLECQVEKRTLELEEKNEEMKELLYTVSHDLKSPLVTVNGFAGMLEQQVQAGNLEKAKDYSERIQRATGTMNMLIKDLLELGRIDRSEIETTKLSLQSVFKDLEEMFGAELDRAGATLVIETDLPVIETDRKLLHQVFQNLISNAIKYGCSEPNSRIYVGCEKTDTEYKLYIRDDGPGIPAEHHTEIFRLFKRLHTDNEGTGLGLAIVTRIARVLKARVWVDSKVGKGATFWFSLPA